MIRVREALSRIYLQPIASILLLCSPQLGVVLWAVLFMQPMLAIVTIAGATSAELIGLLVNRFIKDGFGHAERGNNLLVGLITGWLLLPLEPSLLIFPVVLVTAQMACTLITMVIRRLMEGRGMPVLILPYALVACGLFTLLPGAVHHAAFATDWPSLVSADISETPLNGVRAMGVILLSPWEYAGIAVLLVVFINSPVSFMAGILGWIGGFAVSQGLQYLGVAFAWELTSYNYFLAGFAAATAFFVPSRGSLFMAPFAGGLTAFVAAFLQNFLQVPGLSILPLPFLIASYLLVVGLERGPFRLEIDWLISPADKWLRFTWWHRRWGRPGTPLLALPLTTPARITQGFCASISHKGPWSHALDFEGLTRATPGISGIWGATVLAPVRGVVTDVRDTVPDNPLGTANHSENWGNHVLIRSDDGFHVLVAHLLPGSLSVAPGQRVGFATRIGMVGNSGRSYVPHLHLQAQQQGFAGAPTIPFRLANYLELDEETGLPRRWRASSVPREGDAIAAATARPEVHDLLASILSGQSIWAVRANGDVPSWAQSKHPLVTKTTINSQGNFRIHCGKEFLEARLDIDGWRVIDLHVVPASLIATIAASMVTIPNCVSPGLEWSDALPRPLPLLKKELLSAFLPFSNERLASVEMQCIAIPDGYCSTLKLRAEIAGKSAKRPDISQVELLGKQGPVKAEFFGQGFDLTYTAMSFEVSNS